MWLLFEGGDYSRAASNRRNTVYNKFWPLLHLVFINSIAMSFVILPSSSVEGTLPRCLLQSAKPTALALHPVTRIHISIRVPVSEIHVPFACSRVFRR